MDQLKALSELALTSEIVLLNRGGDAGLKKMNLEWLSHCWSQLNQGETLRKAIETRSDFLLFAAMYLPFQRNGMINEHLERSVRDALRIRGATSHEFPSWVLLLMVRALNVLNIDSPWTIDSCFRSTWLCSQPDPWTISDSSAYSLTHTVFFLTDFGQESHRLPEEHRRYLALWLPVWMEHYKTALHYDMLSEMIMVARCIGMEEEDDWGSILLDRQEKDGMIRGLEKPETDRKEAEESRKEFRDHYHSTLTGFMASVMSWNVSSRAALAETVADPES